MNFPAYLLAFFGVVYCTSESEAAPEPCTVSSSSLDKNHIELISPKDALMTHEHGTEIRVKCKRKFRRRGYLSAFCDDGVMKYQRCFSGSTCRLDQEQMDDNFLELEDKHDSESLYGEGETVQFICKVGYFNRTPLTATCSKPAEPKSVSAEPKLVYPTCIRFGQSCGPPPSVQNGEIVGVKDLNYPSGSIVNYKCANWYILEGKAITCSHGEWDAEPVCRAPCIVRPTDMLQNNIWLKYTHSEDKSKKIYSLHFDNITFECTPGYEIPDEKSLRIQCLDGVLKYPTCLKEGFCILQQHEMVLNDIQYSKGAVIENGQSVVFECAEGMVPLNSLEGKCERRHINYPKCVSTRYGESCGPPPTTLSGDIVDTKKPSYQSGSSVKYKCANFYVLKGNEFVTCTDGEWGKEPTCRAPCTVTASTMLANNIRLKFMFEEDKTKKIYVSHLDRVTFECAPGYNILDEKNLRIQCLDGVVTYPKCL